MHNPVLRFKKSPTVGVASYVIDWLRNGSAAGSGVVNTSIVGDINGYVVSFLTHNVGAVLVGGDVVSATVSAVDAGGLVSVGVASASLTIPATPPENPTNVTLTLT
jgi:hypothetical protein